MHMYRHGYIEAGRTPPLGAHNRICRSFPFRNDGPSGAPVRRRARPVRASRWRVLRRQDRRFGAGGGGGGVACALCGGGRGVTLTIRMLQGVCACVRACVRACGASSIRLFICAFTHARMVCINIIMLLLPSSSSTSSSPSSSLLLSCSLPAFFCSLSQWLDASGPLPPASLGSTGAAAPAPCICWNICTAKRVKKARERPHHELCLLALRTRNAAQGTALQLHAALDAELRVAARHLKRKI